ncbi:MAG: hypothetical protein LBC68_15425, partial [Prevotellaceae bacterium]|nr:hypothetical protein [Prevotellaceae bacterium]
WYHRYFYDYFYDDESDITPDKDYYDTSLGLMLNAYYSFRKIYIGIMYRPDIIGLNSQHKFQYKHLICIDFGWKIRLKSKK